MLGEVLVFETRMSCFLYIYTCRVQCVQYMLAFDPRSVQVHACNARVFRLIPMVVLLGQVVVFKSHGLLCFLIKK